MSQVIELCTMIDSTITPGTCPDMVSVNGTRYARRRGSTTPPTENAEECFGELKGGIQAVT